MEKLIYIFTHLLFLSLAGTAVIVPLFLLCKTGRKRLSNRWKYYVWLIPCIVLLIPFRIPSLPAAAPQKAGAPAVGAVAAEQPQEVPHTMLNTQEQGNAPVAVPTVAQATQEKITPFSLSVSVREAVTGGAALIWLAGILFLLLRGLYHRIRFSVTMHRLTISCSAETENVFKQLCAEMKIRRRVRLKSFNAVGSPFLCGIFRPTVYLPSAELSEAELYAAFKHELTHCKRHDLLLKQIQQILKAVHWFNPFVWLMQKQTEIFCELSCDEAVVSDMDREGRKMYGITILKLMRSGLPVASTSAYLAEKKIKNRLEVIMNYSINTTLKKLISALLAAILCVGSVAFAAELNAKNPNTSTTYHTIDFERASDEVLNGEENSGLSVGVYQAGNYPNTVNVFEVSGSATLTNNPFVKSFNADVTAKNYQYDRELHKYANQKLTEEHRYQVTMNKLTRVLKTNGTWIGTFTVQKDGETILDSAEGALYNVPGLNNSGLSFLNVADSNRSFHLSGMNFGLNQTELLDNLAKKSKEEAEFYQDENTEEIFLQMGEGKRFGELNLASTSSGEFPRVTSHFTLIRNNVQKKLEFAASMPEVGDDLFNKYYTLTLDPKDILSYSSDSVTGTFFLTSYVGSKSSRELKGTLSGLDGGDGAPVTFSSEDGKYSLSLTIAPKGTYDPDQSSELAFQREKNYRYISMEELPFDISIESGDVTLRYKGDPNLRWAAVLATYSAPEETWQPIPQERAVDNTAVFHLVPNYTAHQYLVMEVYSVGEKAQVTSYELSMKALANDVLFTQLTEKKDGEDVYHEVDADGIPTTIKFHYNLY